MNRLFGIFVFGLLFFSVQAQKQDFTLEKAIMGGRDLSPALWSNTQWSNNSNILFYSKRGDFVYKYNAAKNTTDSINFISLANPALTNSGYDKIKSIPSFSLGNKDEFIFTTGGDKISFDASTGKISKISTAPKEVESLDVPDVPGIYSYSKDQGLYVQKADGSNYLVAQGNDSIVYGQSVHQQEFGINKGTFWSPKGNKLAFYRMDQSMVGRYPIPDWSVTPAKVNYIYYPMAGTKSHHVTLGIYDLTSGKTTYLNTGGDPEHYLTNITWSTDGSEIYIAEINRDQDHTVFNAYNPSSGEKLRTLYEERSLQYTEPLEPYTFVPGQNNLFISQSKRDGWNSLYLYNTKGEFIRQLTQNIEVVSLSGFDHKNKYLFFQGILPNSIDQHYFRTELATGKTEQYTNTPGTHTAKISYDGRYAFETNNVFGEKMNYVCRDLKNNKTQLLHMANEPYDNYNLGLTRIDTLLASDGTRLFTRTVFPYDFDPAKKYPVVIYVYGGPHAQMISNRRIAQTTPWMYTLANEGFIVFTLDNRGSSNRGMKFENVTHRNLGDLEIEDQMIGYEFIKGKSYVNPDRIGVHGWSYGGFMTISLMTRQPGKFYAAVAGGPVTDWNMYEIMYTERYMDSPQQNPDGFKKASTFSYINQLEGPMLLIHGTADNVVVWQHSIKYLKACVDQGKQVDYFVYPGHPHNVLGKDRIHLMRKVFDYFELHK